MSALIVICDYKTGIYISKIKAVSITADLKIFRSKAAAEQIFLCAFEAAIFV